MNKKYKYLLKNTGILTISNFSSKLLSFFLVPLYTSVLTTEEYGTFDIINTTLQLLMPFLALNIYEGVMRFMMDKEVDKSDVASVGFKYVNIGILIFLCIILVNYFLDFWPALAQYSVYAFLSFSFTLFFQYVNQFAKGLEYVSAMGIAGVIGTVTTLAFNIILLLHFHMGLDGFYIASIVGQAVPTVYISIAVDLYKYLKIHFNKNVEKDMIIYSAPMIMNQLGWWANNVSDRYVVTFMCGVAANGIYSVAYKIPTILSTLGQIFIQAWQISAIKEYKNKDSKRFYGNALNYMNNIICICCMILILCSKFLGKLLYSKDFYVAWKYTPFLLLAIVFNSASGILGPILTAQKNSKALGVSAFYGALINAVLNVVLVYLMKDAQGAAIATAISSYSIYFFRRRALRNDITILNYSKMIFSWVCIIFQSLLIIYTENYLIQLILIAMVIAAYRRSLKKLFQFGLETILKR